MKDVTHMLREKGVTVTPQRTAVLEFLWGNPDHPSPDEVYRKVKRRFPYISRATVYNTIKALAEAHVLQEVLVQQEMTRVDANVSQHHHFRCVQCGKVEDMPYGLLTKAQAAERAKGYQIQEVHVVVKGVCKKCQ